MLLPKDEIISDIEARIMRTGGDYSDWYVGVAKDTRGTFFPPHLAEERNDGFLYREAFTPLCALEIRDYFVSQHGAVIDPACRDGGRLVYAYMKTPLKPPLHSKNHAFNAKR